MKPNISPSFLTPQQDKFLQFVILMHGDQKRKYTGEPYWYHLVNVAWRAKELNIKFGVEISLGHDLFEDTDCSHELLIEYLKIIGYSINDRLDIYHSIYELSDQFTREEYPGLSRKERKVLEAERLWQVSETSQNVKLCDIEDNRESILEFDEAFGKTYLKEAEALLGGFTNCNLEFRDQLLKQIKEKLNT